MPYTVNDSRWFARFTLILDADAGSQLRALTPFQRNFSVGGFAFAPVDLKLVSLAQSMIAHLVTG